MSEAFHTDFSSSTENPYRVLEVLGIGGVGRVDKVEPAGHEGQCYARKLFFLRRRNTEMIEEIKKEARTLSRLRHRHIASVIGTYCWKTHFGILMEPISEADLASFLAHIDVQPRNENHNRLLLGWSMCLLQAVNYIHELGIKHRDIKPSNILVKDDTNVLLTDFGIARDTGVDGTTGSYGTAGAFTPMYSPPEFFKEGARRGRAADIFSLGCVFLEMCTAVVAPPGSLDRFNDFRVETTGSRVYAKDPTTILRWIHFLWSHWAACYSGLQGCGVALADLAFLMMDSDASARITPRQSIAMCGTAGSPFEQNAVNHQFCAGFRNRSSLDEESVSIHSVFYTPRRISLPADPEKALEVSPARSWEDAKRKWLKEHIHWENEYTQNQLQLALSAFQFVSIDDDDDNERRKKIEKGFIALDEARMDACEVLSIENSIAETLEAPVSGRNQLGYIYIVQSADLPGLVKVGSTRSPVRHLNATRRELQGMSVIHISQEIADPGRVERLVSAHLAPFREELEKWDMRHPIGRARNRGWYRCDFRRDVRIVVEVVQRWVEWMSREPYEYGMVKPSWMSYWQAMKRNTQTEHLVSFPELLNRHWNWMRNP